MKRLSLFFILLFITQFSYCANQQAPDPAMFDAISSKDVNVVKRLLDQGVDANIKNQDGITALQRAIELSDLPIVTLLLDHGADIHAKGPNNMTALDYAETFAMFNLLIERGAIINNKAVEWLVNLGMVHDADSVAKIRLLIAQGYEIIHTLFMEAVAQKNERTVEFLIEAGINPYTKNSSGLNAFDYAQGSQPMMKLLNTTKHVAPAEEPIEGDPREARMRQNDDDIKKMIRRLEHIYRAMNPEESVQAEQKEAAAAPVPNLLADGAEITTLVHWKKHQDEITKAYGAVLDDPLVQQCLDAERRANQEGKYVFYRSEPGQFRVYQYFIEELYRFVHLFNKQVPFVWNRFFADAAQQKTINEYVDMLKEDLKISSALKKGTAFNQLLSANLALFGNVNCKTSNTWDFFLENFSAEKIDMRSLFERIFNLYGFDKKYIKELISIDHSWMDTFATLQQIMIPRAIVDDVAMLGDVGYCFPWPKNVDEDSWHNNAVSVARTNFGYGLGRKWGRHIRISPILDKYMHGSLDPDDTFQVRILMNTVYGLNPDSGIEIHQYSRLPKQSLNHLKKEINRIVSLIFRDWIEKELKNARIPRNVENTPLGKTMKHVGKGRPKPQEPEIQQEEDEVKIDVAAGQQRHIPASIWQLYATNGVLDRDVITPSFMNDCNRDAAQNQFIPQKDPGVTRIMTYNVHFWENAFEEPSYKAIFDVIQSVNADIIVLQEVSIGAGDLASRERDLKSRGYEHYDLKKIHTMASSGDSLYTLIASKYAFEATPTVYVANSPGETRNFINAVISLPNNTVISVYGTHLDIKDESGTIREAQVRQLLAAAEKDPHDNVVLAGDWNTIRKSDYQYKVAGKLVWSILADSFAQRQFPYSGLQIVPTSALELVEKSRFVDSFTKAHAVNPTYTVWTGTVVDFIFCGPKWNIPVTGSYIYYSAASDHLPVIMDIK